jgi:hypothetical protein
MAMDNLRCVEMSVVGCRGEGFGRLCYFEVAKREVGDHVTGVLR